MMGPIELLKSKKELAERAKRNQERDYILEHYYDDLRLSDEIKSSIINVFSNGSIDFDEMFNKYNSQEMYRLNTKIDFDTTIKIAEEFFQTVDSEFLNYFKMRMHDKSGITFGNYPFTNVNTRNIQLTNYGDLRDLYTIVHEFSHMFDSKKGDTTTRNILTETSAQSMERLLDSFLIQLDSEMLTSYGINKEQLMNDILDRRIATFIERTKAINDVKKVMPDFGKKAECSGYMLAELYSTIFSKFSYDEQINKIKDLITAISNNEFEIAINVLEVDLSKNNSNRGKLVNVVINSIISDCMENEKKSDITMNGGYSK